MEVLICGSHTGDCARPALAASKRATKFLEHARLAHRVAHVNVALNPFRREAGREGLPIELHSASSQGQACGSRNVLCQHVKAATAMKRSRKFALKSRSLLTGQR